MSTAEAGRVVGIKQTSACRIINSYKKKNRIFERKADRLLRQNDSPVHQEQKISKTLEEKNGNNIISDNNRSQTPNTKPIKKEKE